MSLSSIAATARHALANPPAKRGMFALVERRHSSTAMHGATKRYTVYVPGIVVSVDRAGLAKEVRTAAGQRLKRGDWQSVTIDARCRIADPENVAGRLVDASGTPIEFPTLAEAVAAIKSAAGLV